MHRQPHLIFLSAFGPTHAPHAAFHRMFRQHLPRSGLQHSGLEAEIPWSFLSFDRDSCRTGGPVRQKLMSWLDQLLTLVELEPQLGAMVCIGRADSPMKGAFGAALEEIHALIQDVQPGHVRLSAGVAELLEHALLRVAPVPYRECARWVPEERSLYWIQLPTSEGSLRGLAHGDVSCLVGLDLQLRLVQAFRGPTPAQCRSVSRRDMLHARLTASALTPLTPPADIALTPEPEGDPCGPETDLIVRFGDQIELETLLPSGACLQILRLIDGDFCAVPDLPLQRAGHSPHLIQLRFVLDDRRGLETVVAIITTHARAIRQSLIRETIRERSSARALIALGHLLRDGGELPSFLIVMAESFQHAPARPEIPPLLEPVQAQLVAANVLSALQRIEELIAEEPTQTSRAYAGLLAGIALRRQGDPAGAIARLHDAVCIAQGQLDVSLAARAMRELGRTQLELNRFNEASVTLLWAARMHEWANDPLEAARCHVYLGLLHLRMDCFEAARDAYLRALTPARQADDGALLGVTLEGLGQVYHDLGHQRAARAAFDEALSVFAMLPNPIGVMRLEGDLGLLELDFGRPGNAVTHFLRQMELVEPMGAPAWRGIVRVGLGRGYLSLGRLRLARRFLRESLELLPESEKGNRSIAFVALAESALADGQPEEAASWLSQVDPRLARSKVEMSWRLALALGQVQSARRDLAGAEAAFKDGLELVERWRSKLSGRVKPYALEVAISLHEGWIEHLLEQKAPADRLLEALENAHARAFVDAQAAREPYVESGPDRVAFTHYPMDRRDRKKVGPIQGDGASIPPSLFPLEWVPEGVTFLVTFCLPRAVVVARVTRAHVDYRVLSLTRETLATRVWHISSRCASIQTDPDAAEVLEALSLELLLPINDWLSPLEPGMPLGIVAHGPLHQLPWSCLPLPAGHPRKGEPLIATADLFFTPSLKASAWWIAHAPPVTRGGLVVADADGDLPHALTEGTLVSERLGNATLFTGEEANWAQLQSCAAHARFLHLAVHAVRQGPHGAALLLLAPSPPARVEAAQKEDERAAVTDGDVSIEDIASLQLDAALVVLSACEAGAGALSRAGEGPDLLPWAFLTCGARAVIASGWRVPDAATLALMKGLYSHLRSGFSPGAALARAQRDLFKAQRETPGLQASWAGFSLVGDWRGGGDAAHPLEAGHLLPD